MMGPDYVLRELQALGTVSLIFPLYFHAFQKLTGSPGILVRGAQSSQLPSQNSEHLGFAKCESADGSMCLQMYGQPMCGLTTPWHMCKHHQGALSSHRWLHCGLVQRITSQETVIPFLHPITTPPNTQLHLHLFTKWDPWLLDTLCNLNLQISRFKDRCLLSLSTSFTLWRPQEVLFIKCKFQWQDLQTPRSTRVPDGQVVFSRKGQQIKNKDRCSAAVSLQREQGKYLSNELLDAYVV